MFSLLPVEMFYWGAELRFSPRNAQKVGGQAISSPITNEHVDVGRAAVHVRRTCDCREDSVAFEPDRCVTSRGYLRSFGAG